MKQLRIITRKAFSVLRHRCFKMKANYRLAKAGTRHFQEDRQIRVLFIVQMTEIWDKEAAVCEAMMRSPRFSPLVVVVPAYDIVRQAYSEYGLELAYFEQKYGREYVIKAYSDIWLDLKDLHPDYVFYQRCWEYYLPSLYHTDEVLRYAKTCYIPYCFHVLNDSPNYYRTEFFYNLYIFFCCSEQQKLLQEKTKRKKVFFLGFPALESIALSEQICSNSISVLWTPRWTNDSETGGSNFLRYMKDILSLKDDIPGVDVVLRPHPLAFQNAIREGNLTEKDEQEYRSKVAEKGMRFDTNIMVEETFEKVDVLVTDFSSILIPFFLTGKPIIYCSETNLQFSEVAQRVINSTYRARDWQQVLYYLRRIRNGEDELREQRVAEAKSIKEAHEGSVERILDAIVNDF